MQQKPKSKNIFTRGLKHIAKVAIQGIFWLAPIIAIIAITLWLYGKINFLTGSLFNLFGFNPENYPFLWFLLGVSILIFIAYLVGNLVDTHIAGWLEKLLLKIPGYSTVKDLVNIFNSSKKGEKHVLVVLISGFAKQGYNVGLMYSTKESIIKDHYTVTLSQTPIPNGGYLFEVHKDNIKVLKQATFDHNLQYLLSMGVKSLAEITKVSAIEIDNLPSLDDFLKADE